MGYIFCPPYSLQKSSYSPQFFFYVNLKYIALMYAKKAGFLAIVGTCRLNSKKTRRKSKIYIFRAILQPTKSFLQPPILFLCQPKVHSLNICQKGGLFSHCGHM